MSRRLPAPFRAVSTFAVPLLVLVLAGCQSQVPQTLTDPKAILAAAATTTATATSVRLDVTADGSLVIDPLGTGAGAPMTLDGTTASADIDLAGGDARATFSLPGLLGLAGEVVAFDGKTYVKTSLTGPQYQVTDVGDPGPAASVAPETVLKGLSDFLAQPALEPVKGDDVPCGGGTCYTVRIELTAEELAALGAGAALPSNVPMPLPDLSAANLDLTIRVEQATTRLAGVTAVIGLGGTGDMTAELTFSKWNEPVSISAPPADQLAPG